MKDVINQTFTYLEKENEAAVMTCLKVNSDVSLIDIVDERGYTLLHEACFQNFESLT